ncbi:hypothetical protein CUMW_115750 [Citrus unshiu]|uniref:MADS-box domain-containing protein n=1 Tax=Citrus unshiu TaxID=55188 RepID=A0A2H5P9F0_CITUN|nr:agamous-like MADS-box protein AGL103 [Citrus sinensis]GAY48978.1 hypothetical protein CUMW_115750 [Citrus unshiu]
MNPMDAETTQVKRKRSVKLIEEHGGNSRQGNFEKRKETLKNKAHELETLCDVMVCLVCYGPDGKVETWPEDKTKVNDMINKYKELREMPVLMKKAEQRLDLLELFESKKQKLMEKKKAFVEKMFSILETKIDEASSVEELGVVYNKVESKFASMRETIELAIIEEQKNQQFAAPPIWPQVYGNNLLMSDYVSSSSNNNNAFGRQESCLFPPSQNHQINGGENGNIGDNVMLPDNNFLPSEIGNNFMLPDDSLLPGYVHANEGAWAQEKFSGLIGGPCCNCGRGPSS